MTLGQVKRLRWAVRAALLLGVAASVAANILHARHNPISQAIAAWPPLALLLTVELISRIPVHRRALGIARMFAAAAIAGIAAWVSYWHMAGVADRYGETGSAPYLLPFSVDGLIVVASICLVELNDRIRALSTLHSAPVPEPVAAAAGSASADSTADTSVDITMDTPVDNTLVRRRTLRRRSNAERVARLAARMPDATAAELAAKLNVSVKTVYRHLSAKRSATTVDSDADTTSALSAV